MGIGIDECIDARGSILSFGSVSFLAFWICDNVLLNDYLSNSNIIALYSTDKKFLSTLVICLATKFLYLCVASPCCQNVVQGMGCSPNLSIRMIIVFLCLLVNERHPGSF